MFRKRNLIKLAKTRKLKRFRRRFRYNFYKANKIKRDRSFKGPVRVSGELATAFVEKREYKKIFRKRRTKKAIKKIYSRKINLELFKITYDMLISYHSPLGKRLGEWKPSVMMTNIFLIRNTISILDLTTVFFSLRKMTSRLFKALKLRRGVALLNGRNYKWQKIFTFVFERWLPGFFTNFHLNIKELISYFLKRKHLTRRQKTRILSLKMLSYDPRLRHNRNRKKKRRKYLLARYLSKLIINKKIKMMMKKNKKLSVLKNYFVKTRRDPMYKRVFGKFLKSFSKEELRRLDVRKRRKKRRKLNRLISFMKLPSVSMSLVDNYYWLRECRKEGIANIQVTDASSEIEKIDYPIISNQSSIAFLSFITLLAKEIAYQARYWELTNFKTIKNYYVLNDRLKKNSVKYASLTDFIRVTSKFNRYKYRLKLGYPVRKRYEKIMKAKLDCRYEIYKWANKKELNKTDFLKKIIDFSGKLELPKKKIKRRRTSNRSRKLVNHQKNFLNNKFKFKRNNFKVKKFR